MGPMAYQGDKKKIPSPAKTNVNRKQSNIYKQCDNCKDNDMMKWLLKCGAIVGWVTKYSRKKA